MGFPYSRIKVEFCILKKNEKIYDLHYPTYTLLLKQIFSKSPDLAEKIHNGKIKRAFLFSNFIFNNSPKRATKTHFYIASSYSQVNDILLKTLSNTYQVDLMGNVFEVKNVQIQTCLVENECFPLLSPLILRDKSGKTLQKFEKNKIETMIKDSLIRIGKRKNISGNVDIEVKGELKEKLYNIKGTTWRAFAAKSAAPVIKIKGDEIWKQLALYFGLGDKTHFGFGMLGV